VKSGIFLTILLILGIFVIPYNIQNSYGDRILLYTIHRTAGSVGIHTENLIKERCFVHAQIDVYLAHHGVFHRNNHDKTFYPGDAFDYQTTTWKDGCENFRQPCPTESTPSNTIPNEGPCTKDGAVGSDKLIFENEGKERCVTYLASELSKSENDYQIR